MTWIVGSPNVLKIVYHDFVDNTLLLKTKLLNKDFNHDLVNGSHNPILLHLFQMVMQCSKGTLYRQNHRFYVNVIDGSTIQTNVYKYVQDNVCDILILLMMYRLRRFSNG